MSAATYGHSNVVTELISLGAFVDIQNYVSHCLPYGLGLPAKL